MKNMINAAKVIKGVAATSAGTTTVETAVIDTAGYDGAIIVTTVGTSNAGNYLKVQQDSDAAFGTGADLEGSKITPASADVITIDIHKPEKRYLKAFVARGASTTVGEIYVFLYNSVKEPENNGQIEARSGYAGKFLLSPSEGTA